MDRFQTRLQGASTDPSFPTELTCDPLSTSLVRLTRPLTAGLSVSSTRERKDPVRLGVAGVELEAVMKGSADEDEGRGACEVEEDAEEEPRSEATSESTSRREEDEGVPGAVCYV